MMNNVTCHSDTSSRCKLYCNLHFQVIIYDLDLVRCNAKNSFNPITLIFIVYWCSASERNSKESVGEKISRKLIRATVPICLPSELRARWYWISFKLMLLYSSEQNTIMRKFHTRPTMTWTAASPFIRSHQQALGNHINARARVGFELSISVV